MGGDNAPDMVIRGADIARQRFPQVHFKFFGDQARLKAILDTLPALAAVSSIHHADTVVTMEAKPGQALRSGRGNSMRLAIDTLQRGEAHAAVLSVNPGALIAMV